MRNGQKLRLVQLNIGTNTLSCRQSVDAGTLAATAGETRSQIHAALSAGSLAPLHASGLLIHEILLVLGEILLGVVKRLNGKISPVNVGRSRRVVLAGLVC